MLTQQTKFDLLQVGGNQFMVVPISVGGQDMYKRSKNTRKFKTLINFKKQDDNDWSNPSEDEEEGKMEEVMNAMYDEPI